eukprot:1162115-Pelagomonas_calceolata.AAC.1
MEIEEPPLPCLQNLFCSFHSIPWVGVNGRDGVGQEEKKEKKGLRQPEGRVHASMEKGWYLTGSMLCWGMAQA